MKTLLTNRMLLPITILCLTLNVKCEQVSITLSDK